MEAKRELSSVDLAAVARELSVHAGARLDKAYLYGDDLVRLRMRDFDVGRVEILCEIGDAKRVHRADPGGVPDAPGRPPEFAMMLRSRLANAELVGVQQYEFDRILEFEFEGEEASHTMVVELFGDGNVALVDATGQVVDSLRTVRLKSRTVVSGAQYEHPASRVNPLAVDADEFAARMADSDADVVRTLATQLNLGGRWAEELCTRAGVEKTLAIADADDASYDALFAELASVAAALEAGEFDPRVYYEDGQAVDVAPFPLEERADLESEAYDDFQAALDVYFHELAAAGDEAPDRPDFDERIAEYERIIDQQEAAIERFEADAEAEREKAEALYAHYDIVDEVISTVRAARGDDVAWEEIEARLAEGANRGIAAAEAVVGVSAAEGTVTLELGGHRVAVDPAMGVEKNADRRYREAKAIEEKREGAEEALEESRAGLAEAKRRRDDWEADDDEPDAKDGEQEEAPTDWRSMPSVPVRHRDHWYERFRWFHTTDEFLVLGGRNADQNEELVKKYLEPGDRFVHSQAHGAPVTVIKATDPSESGRDVDIPESTERQAARFAVSYSSAWKEGHFSGDAYAVDHDQVSKTPEPGEYLSKGSFAVRGDRDYYRDVAVGAAVGVQCEPDTRVVGGPPEAVEGRVETLLAVEPGRYAQGDIAKRIYRRFREAFADETFVRKIASPDEIAKFLPPGGSRLLDADE
jgi:predicted ribosome quality control (RQC) complex YloA/Tae2 family protein